MADIVFFEKPGCINGGKQKAILRAAGHNLCCIDILNFTWKPEKLLEFVNGKQPHEMMNHTAPAIKKGEINPAALSFHEALELMIADPVLIKRPLIEVDDLRIQGFDDNRLRPYLGDLDGTEDVITCPNLNSLSCDKQAGREL